MTAAPSELAQSSETIDRLIRQVFYLERYSADVAAQHANLLAELADSHQDRLRHEYQNRIAAAEHARQLAAAAADSQARIGQLQARLWDGEARIRQLADQVAVATESLAALTEEIRCRDARITRLHDQYGARLRRQRIDTVRHFLREQRARRAREMRAAATLRRSALFDAPWYLAQNPDIARSRADPLMHYITAGAAEGRDPGPDFSTTYYVRTYADVLDSDCNPLEHFELFGRAAGRLTQPAPPPEPVAAAAAPPAAEPQAPASPAPAPADPPPPAPPQIIFISGDAHAPGHRRRVVQYAQAADALGMRTEIYSIAEASSFAALLEHAALVIMWRVAWTAEVAHIMLQLRAFGVPILFDLDELLIDPSHARLDDPAADAAAYAISLQRTMNEATFCSAPSATLLDWLRRTEKPGFRLPSGFDATGWRTARRAARARRAAGEDGLTRIGVLGSSRADAAAFRAIAGAVAQLLRERPDTRLVLVGDAWPALGPLQDVARQIEWRRAVGPQARPWEVARLDLLVLPGELGDPFFDAADETGFVEAALAGVPTIAAATRGLREVLRDGQTGVLVSDGSGWHAALSALLDDREGRTRMARAAYHDVIWAYGPERRAELMCSLLEQTVHRGRRAARAFELELDRSLRPRPALPIIPDTDILLSQDQLREADLTVVVPLYNYAAHVIEALDSVAAQSLAALDLVVVDDCSTDASSAVARDWMVAHAARFGRIVLLRNRQNQGLAHTRNAGFAAAETRFVLPLDADNKLLAACAARCLDRISSSGAAFAYPALQQFGDGVDVFSDHPYDPARFAAANYIDATAVVRVAAWAAVGGYHDVRYGWEDYDLWCRFAEQGLFGCHVPEILGLYRVHRASMLRSLTERDKPRLIEDMRRRHPWVLQGAVAG